MWKRLHWYEPKRPYIRAHHTWTEMALPIWGKMAVVMRAVSHQGAELSSTEGRIGFWWGWNGSIWPHLTKWTHEGPNQLQWRWQGHFANLKMKNNSFSSVYIRNCSHPRHPRHLTKREISSFLQVHQKFMSPTASQNTDKTSQAWTLTLLVNILYMKNIDKAYLVFLVC